MLKTEFIRIANKLKLSYVIDGDVGYIWSPIQHRWVVSRRDLVE